MYKFPKPVSAQWGLRFVADSFCNSRKPTLDSLHIIQTYSRMPTEDLSVTLTSTDLEYDGEVTDDGCEASDLCQHHETHRDVQRPEVLRFDQSPH